MTDTLSKLKKTSPKTLLTHDKAILKFLTCGSVDDGKSTLLGRLLFETDSIFENEVNTITNANGYIDYAHLVDGLESEREQGITIDVAYRYFQTSKRKFIAIDTPGHVQYTRNMATGASNAALAIIMIDASKSLLEQSKRHSIICSLLGIKHIIVCVNKMDLVNFCEKTFLSIKSQYSDFAEKLHFETTEFLPASALRGDNITKISEMMSWYKGKSLLQYLEEKDIDRNNLTQTARMPVQWVCRPNQDFRGYAGTLCQGKIHVGDSLMHLPSKQTVKIKGIHRGKQSQQKAENGQAVMIELDREIDVARGDVLCCHNKPASVSCQFQATILWMNEEPLVTSRQYSLQLGSKKTLCTVSRLKYQLDINSLNKVAASSIKLNEIGVCELSTVEPIAFEAYQVNKTLGGFILIDRLSHQTIACGFIDFALRRANNIHYQPFHIGPVERSSIKGHKPCALWFTGISGAGKSAIANELELQLNQQNKHTVTLDGDNVRFGLCKDLGFTDSARCENIRRISEVSKLMVDAGLLTIISFISPFKAERDMAKELIGAGQFIEIFIDTPLSIAEKRDVKGLYKKVRAGEIKNFTGIDSPYEKPLSPDIHIKTQHTSIKEAVVYILQHLEKKGIL